MALNISFTTTFDRTTGKINFTDTTNYTAGGYPLGFVNQMKGYIKVTYNTGSGPVVVYNNTPVPPNPPWPTPDSSNTGAVVNFVPSTINIPLTSAGVPLPAQYQVTYTVVIFALLPQPTTYTFTQTNTYQYTLVDPSVCIETVVNCNESAVQSQDTTVYTIPDGVITSLVRAHTLYPPVTSGATVLGPLNQTTLVYSPIYTTTWTAEIISTVTYTMNDGLIVVVALSGVKEFQVVCDTNLSKILCCLVNLQNEYEALLCKNPVKAQMFKDNKLDPSLQHLALFLAAQSAGNQSKMDTEYAELVKASGCGGDCGCGDSVPALVPTIGVGFSYSLQSSTNSIVVTTTVVGSTISWDININPAILAAITGSTTVVSTTTPNSLSITQVGVPPALDYQVDFIPNEIEKLLVIDPTLNATPDYLEFTQTDIVNSGVNINPVGSQSVILGTDNAGNVINPNAANSLAVFTLSGMLVNNSVTFTATCNVMSSLSGFVGTSVVNLAAEVFHIDTVTATIYLRLYNPQNGQVYTLQDIKTGTWDKVYIKFNLKA